MTTELQLTVSRRVRPSTPAITGSLVFAEDVDSAVHHHDRHELLWHVVGTLRVVTGDEVWIVAPATGLWLPAGTAHSVTADAGARYGWATFDPDACPLMWDRTTTIDTTVLLRSLLAHLTADLQDDERVHAESVVFDILHRLLSVPLRRMPLPHDPRCRAITDALLREPAIDLGLPAWGQRVGAGSRTLTRLFLAETGMTFTQWRTHARIHAAVALLATGTDVGVVARRVGYRTTSGFVSSFCQLTGRTPGAYLVAEATTDDDDQPYRRVV